jgi:hypothetical protein
MLLVYVNQPTIYSFVVALSRVHYAALPDSAIPPHKPSAKQEVFHLRQRIAHAFPFALHLVRDALNQHLSADNVCFSSRALG